MELYMALIIGVLLAGGTYLILRPNLIRIVMGLGLYSNAANLAMITAGGYTPSRVAPFITGEAGEPVNTAALMDPLPPDIILTAIVISFAVGALFLTVCYRVYLDYRTDNPNLLPNEAEEGEAAAALEEHDDPRAAEAEQAVTPPRDPAVRSAVPDLLAELAQPNPHSPRERGFNPLPAGESRLSGGA